MKDASGGNRHIGFLLGLAVDANGSLLKKEALLPQSGNFWRSVEEFVVGLAGRYVLLVEGEDETRMYGDPSQSLPIYYDSESQTVGSSLLMCLTRSIEKNPLIDYEDAIGGTERYRFGHTPDIKVKRAYANYYLDLDTFQQKRFWPVNDDIETISLGDTQPTIDRINKRLGSIFGGLVNGRPCLVPISGGNDSRVLVSAGRAHLSKVEEFFVHTFHKPSRMDARSADLVGEVLGIDIKRYDIGATKQPTRHQERRRKRRFYATTGYSGPAMIEVTSGLYDRLPFDLPVLRGNVQEILRTQHPGDSPERPHRRVHGLKRGRFTIGGFDKEFISKWLTSYDKWYEELPQSARSTVFDFVFFELYLMNFGIMSLSFTNNFFITPFNDRALIALSCGLPIEYRAQNLANKDLLRSASPDLVDVPYARSFMGG